MKNRWILLLLILLVGLTQYRLWFGKNSVPDYKIMQSEINDMEKQNANLVQRNALLKADINDLQIGIEAMEERARNELGMIKEGETFYRILPQEQ